MDRSGALIALPIRIEPFQLGDHDPPASGRPIARIWRVSFRVPPSVNVTRADQFDEVGKLATILRLEYLREGQWRGKEGALGGAERIVVGQLTCPGTVKVYSSGS